MSGSDENSRYWRWTVVLALLLTVVVADRLVGSASPVQQRAGPRTVVSLTFNDGLASQYRHARPILKSNGLTGTFFVASHFATSRDRRYMTAAQLDRLYRDGNEIGGMGSDHQSLAAIHRKDPAADLAYKRAQVCDDRDWLGARGYAPVSFSYPFAAVSRAGRKAVRACGYIAARSTGGLSATGPRAALDLPPADPFRIDTLSVGKGPATFRQLTGAVRAAARNGGGWLPIAFHEVCGDGAPERCLADAHSIEAEVLARFAAWLRDGAPAGVTVERVRDVMGAPEQPQLPQRETVVSLTFDDALASQYRLRPTLAAYGVQATFYVPSGPVDRGGPGSMTWAQIRDLQADGHDIGGHTVDHVDLGDPETTLGYKWRQVCDDREALLDRGIDAVSFAYPFAGSERATERIVKGCGYQSGRAGGGLSVQSTRAAGQIPPRHRYRFPILGAVDDGPLTLEALKSATNAAIRDGGGWLPVVFHEVCDSLDPAFSTCMARYRSAADTTVENYLAWMQANESRGVVVRSVSAVVDRGRRVPAVTIRHPERGRAGSSAVIAGTASARGSVTVALYPGWNTFTPPIASATTQPRSGQWSLFLGGRMQPGRYTVQARQSIRGVTGYSVPRTFRVR